MSILLRGNGSPVYRLRAVIGTDSYGDPAESWDGPGRTPIRGARWEDVTSVEIDGQVRALIRSERTLFAPGAADLTANDRVEILGEVWRVEGDPVVHRGLAGTHTTATLRRFDG